MEERLLRKLIASIKCSSCGQQYEVYNIDVLGYSEGLWFLSVLCSSCNAQSLVAAIIEEKKKPKVITDLTKEELGKFAAMGVVGSDDVLNMHSFLKNFKGDFSRLLEQG